MSSYLARRATSTCLFLLFACSSLNATTHGGYKSIQLDFTRAVPSRQEVNLIHSSLGIFPFRRNQEALFVSKTYQIGLKDSTPFLAFALKARFSGYDSSLVEFRVRFSSDSLNWSEWLAAAPNPEGVLSDSNMVSVLQFIEADQRFAEFMILFHESPPTAPVIRMQSLELDFFSPGMIPIPNPEAMSQSIPGMNPDCACAMPLFASRTAWSCPDGDQASCSSPAFSTVSHLIIHHSAGSNTSANWAATVLSIWNYHVNINGWCDIGYNWLIDPLGNIYQGRGGGNNVVGAHFCSQNSGTMGICMLGDYESASPGETALRSLARLLAWKACDAEIAPSDTSLQSSSGLMLPVVSGHQGGCNTLCPGTNLWSLLPAIRQESDSLLQLCNMVQGTGPETDIFPLSVYPNPAGDRLHLVLPAGQIVQDIRVFTPEGREVMRLSDTFRGTVPIDLSTLLPGLYLLEAEGNGQVFAGKVQVIR